MIKANLDTWGSQVTNAGFSINETPTLFHLNDDAHPLQKITGAAWGANIPANMAPPLKEFVRKK
jgi:hypothetical protein